MIDPESGHERQILASKFDPRSGHQALEGPESQIQCTDTDFDGLEWLIQKIRTWPRSAHGVTSQASMVYPLRWVVGGTGGLRFDPA